MMNIQNLEIEIDLQVEIKRRNAREVKVLKTIVSIYNLNSFSVADRNSEERRYIISKWTKNFEQEKEDEMKRRGKAEAQMNLLLLEQKLKEKFNTGEKEKGDNI